MRISWDRGLRVILSKQDKSFLIRVGLTVGLLVVIGILDVIFRQPGGGSNL